MPANRRGTGRGQHATRTSFQAGASGNPSGRPKATPNEIEVRDLARLKSRRAVERLGEILESQDERAAMRAAEAILDRAWGRPVQAIQTTTPPSRFDTMSEEELGQELERLGLVRIDGKPITFSE